VINTPIFFKMSRSKISGFSMGESSIKNLCRTNTDFKIYPITHRAKHVIAMIAWIPIQYIVKEERTLHAWMKIPAYMRSIGAIGFYDIFY